MRKIAKRNGKEFPAFLFENSESVEVYVDKHEADTTAVSLLTVLRTSQTLRRKVLLKQYLIPENHNMNDST